MQTFGIYKAFMPALDQNPVDNNILFIFVIQLHKREDIRTVQVLWKQSLMHMIKLNSSGASKGNPGLSGGGGIIRDSHGNVLYAFGSLYGVKTNFRAETKAVVEVLKASWRLDFQQVWLELDFVVLVGILLLFYFYPLEYLVLGLSHQEAFAMYACVYISYIYRRKSHLGCTS